MNAAEATRPRGSGRVSRRHAPVGRRRERAPRGDATTARASRRTCSTASSTPSSPPRTRARAWGSASPWSTGSSSPTGATSRCGADRGTGDDVRGHAAPRPEGEPPTPRSPRMPAGRPERAGRVAGRPRARRGPLGHGGGARRGLRPSRSASWRRSTSPPPPSPRARAVELGGVPRGAARPRAARRRAPPGGHRARPLRAGAQLRLRPGAARGEGRRRLAGAPPARVPRPPGRAAGPRPPRGGRRPSTRSATPSGSCTAPTGAARCRCPSTSPTSTARPRRPAPPAGCCSRGAVR